MTMTATPIPAHPVYGALGARDMSVISTPPTNRLAVKTQMIGFDEETIRGAIEQELHAAARFFSA